MAAFNPQFQLYSAEFNNDEFTSANHLAKAMLTKSEWLSPIVTFLYGGGSADYASYNFPMLWLTEGQRNITTRKEVGSADLSYKVPVLGRPKKASPIAKTIHASTDKAGLGHTEFKVLFKDRLFFKSQSLYTPSGKECRVQINPEQKDGGWLYTLTLYTSSAADYVPYSDLVAGKKWTGGIAKVSKERSRGVESRSYTPYALHNQLNVVRATYNIVGNMKNKVMVLEIKAAGKSMKYWVQWELFLHDLNFKEQLENDLWFSTFNKDSDGIIHNRDIDSGDAVTSGAGIWQQIDNEDTYAKLSSSKLDNLITDIFFNASGSQKVIVDVYTGTGGMNEASRAMEERISSYTLLSDKVMKSSSEGKNMYTGPYFNSYMHREGHIVNFRYHPMFDRGLRAENSDPHPIYGHPSFSYNFVAVDTSIVDGESNVQYVSEMGREYIEKMIQGMAQLPGGEDSMYASTDIDASSIQKIKTQGIHLKKPTNCFKLLFQM